MLNTSYLQTIGQKFIKLIAPSNNLPDENVLIKNNIL